jgi:hypothetical protein
MATMALGNRLYVPCTNLFFTMATATPVAAVAATGHPADLASRLAAQLKPVTKCSKLTFVSGTHPSPTLTLRASRAGDLIKGGV